VTSSLSAGVKLDAAERRRGPIGLSGLQPLAAKVVAVLVPGGPVYVLHVLDRHLARP
jgi:hypothetical protein